ncbi:S-adenosyl-L-methionine-dependent methyltransferase [Glarea lozoyensis ATCC 20868]|uniref:S-adenosyl-L-methionine-dependent methyltransferase n=1 Tax=Glarea lozoyensis (strain ATCC 20868 / MF5171) TaxID=1116229 RepID=S3D2G9_GLAL2|nr:S-adenosyl-L-methionine-dependent methyltransferase [Glarea lozoyensis ATCC 20868]EPE31329.1 S-adenosyl-L-methionine-dependent methyltransferase [Glarea lozoyensis ATCC 20868]
MEEFLILLGPEIEDPEEESFLLFSQSIPSQDLGFVDSKATTLELSIGGHDLTIHQSPTVLSSNRDGGTTGAVVWKVTPLFASWISASSNILFQHKIIDANSTVLELGCGISGIIGLTLGPHVSEYVLTDQQYVSKLLNQNLEENRISSSSTMPKSRSNKAKKQNTAPTTNIHFKTLDWETDEVTSSLSKSENHHGFDVVIACDCIYNDMLIKPLVQTSVDACNLRRSDPELQPTIVIVGQQLRSDEVFESWLKEFHQSFRVWRVPDEYLTDGLRSDSGFVVHVGVLRG